MDELIEDGQRQVDEPQIDGGAPTSRMDPEKTAEHLITLLETQFRAAGKIPAVDKVWRDESYHSDRAGSVESHPTWSSCLVYEETL